MSFGQLDFTGSYDPIHGGVVDLSTVGQAVTFYQRSVIVPFRTEQEGRPVYRQADYVKVATPGEHDEIDREATPADKRRYAKQWAAYESGRQNLVEGTPLAVLFPSNEEIVEGLKHHKIHTVEQLASLSDHGAQNLPMGGSEWCEKAKRFLDLTKDAGRLGKIEQRQRQLDADVQSANEENDRLRARVAELEAAAAKKPRVSPTA